MAFLTLASLFLETMAAEHVPTWNPPVIGLTTLVLGWAWLARVGIFRFANVDDRMRVLEDRIDRLERNQRFLEDELRRRHM